MEVIANTTVISNFALISRLDVLMNTVKVCTTDQVVEELKACIERGFFKIDIEIEIAEIGEEEKDTFSKLKERLGKGEASCLAIGMHRGLNVLTDDFDVRKFAQRTGIPVSGTIGVLVKAVEKGIISMEEGNEMLRKMIEKGFYSPIETLDKFCWSENKK